MPEDASLDEFLGGDGADQPVEEESADEMAEEESAEETADAASTETEPTAEDDGDGTRVSPAAVEPARSTAAWSADGGPCSACGAVVSYRWEGEPGLVCPDCKEW